MSNKARRSLKAASHKSAILNVLNGNILSQLITIGSYVVLVRIYSPSDFGAYSTFISLVSIFSAISLLRIDRLMYRWTSDKDRIEAAYGACNVLSLAFSLIATAVAIFVYLPHSKSCLDLSIFSCLVGAGVLFTSLNAVQTFFLIDNSFYKVNTRSLILKAGAVLLAQVLLLFLDKAYGMSAGYALGAAACFAYVNKNLGQDILPSLRSIGQRCRDLMSILCNSRNFLLFSNAQSVVNSFNNNIATLVIGSVFGLKIAGFYLMADRICRLPINLIANSLRQVLTKIFSSSDLKSGGVVYSRNISLVMVCISLPLVIVAIFLSEEFTIFAFGPQWVDVATSFNILVWWSFFSLIASPYQTNVFVNHTKELFGIEIMHLGAKLLATAWAYFVRDFESTLIFFVSASIFYYFSIIAYSEIFSQRQWLKARIVPPLKK